MDSGVLRKLDQLDLAQFKALCSNYTTTQIYRVSTHQEPGPSIPLRVSLTLDLVDLEKPEVIEEWVPEETDIDEYRSHLSDGLTFGYFVGDQIQGLIIGRHQAW
jgi:hypothetical protein